MVAGLPHSAREAVVRQHDARLPVGEVKELESQYDAIGVPDFDTCPEFKTDDDVTSYDEDLNSAGKDGCIQMCRLILEERSP